MKNDQHPAAVALATVLHTHAMDGPTLRLYRADIGQALGVDIPQHVMAKLLGTSQPTYSRIENAERVPHRVALVARLLLAVARQAAVPAPLRPSPDVLDGLAAMAEAVAGAFGDDGGDDFRALTFMALGSHPAVTDWAARYRAVPPQPSHLVASLATTDPTP